MAKTFLERIDWLVVLATTGLLGLGLVYLQSASPGDFRKQVMWVGLSLMGLLVTAMIDYRIWLRYAYELYGIALVLLVVVLLMPEVRGARSWIRLPGLNIQPTEIMKFALILVLARNLRNRETQSTVTGLLAPFLLTLVPMALVLKQPDLGSAILLPGLLFAVVFLSGARVIHLAIVASAGVLSFIPMWMVVMKGYQKRRILAFLNPELYEAREAYQLIMSLIAIGSGGLYGMGLGKGSQNALDMLPDKQNDFIFGVIAEEGGFLIAGLVLLLYALLVWAGLAIARRTGEPGGRLIAVGVAAIIGVQALINVGVVTAMLPTTGITLPLISYGGSSMIVTLAMIGLLLNVGARPQLMLDRELLTGELPVR